VRMAILLARAPRQLWRSRLLLGHDETGHGAAASPIASAAVAVGDVIRAMRVSPQPGEIKEADVTRRSVAVVDRAPKCSPAPAAEGRRCSQTSGRTPAEHRLRSAGEGDRVGSASDVRGPPR
jgi:hypothetical protein